MKALIASTLLGSLTRLSLVDRSGTPVASGTVAMTSQDSTGRVATNYVPFVVVGNAATSLHERVQGLVNPVVSLNGVPRQERWEDETGKKSRTRIQGLRAEIIDPEGLTFKQDSAGGSYLIGGMNHTLLGGNVVKAPEVKPVTVNGEQRIVAEFSIALNEKYKDRAGNDQTRVSFVDVTAWGPLAEMARSFKKGTAITGEFTATSDSWTDKDGNKRSRLKFEAARLAKVVPPAPKASTDDQPLPALPQATGAVPTNDGVEEEDLPF